MPAGDARPALDVALPAASPALPARLDFLLDDLRPVAIEEVGAAAGAAAPPPAPPDEAPPDEAPPTGFVVRRVHFAAPADRAAARRAIACALAADGVTVRPVDVPDEGWAARSQARLRAVRVGRVVVAPPWDAAPVSGAEAAAGRVLVVIEPSTGFGTGHHASTRLCLRALDACLRRASRPPRVLDLGTGSGVLAIAAHKLGAAGVVALDRDPDALANARDNLARNAAADAVRLREADLAHVTGPAADVVTANLSGAVLVRHAARLAGLVRPGGRLIAGGVMADEADGVAAAFAGMLTPTGRDTEADWAALTFGRNSDG